MNEEAEDISQEEENAWWFDRFSEAMDEKCQYEDEIEASNQRLLKAILKVKGELFYEWLLLFIEDMSPDGKFSIAKAPEGNKQRTGNERSVFGKIKEYWVNQWSVGDSGDSFAGILFIQLKENKYLAMPYSSY